MMEKDARPDSDFDLELAQHAVEGRLHWFDVDRRAFLKVLGGGVLVCLAVPRATAQESGRARGGRELPKDLGAWLHIAEDGRVTVFTGKVEMGQNIRTSLAQQVAEELRVPVESIRHGHGRHGPRSVGRGDLRQPDDADNGAAASPRGGGGARTAGGPRGGAVEGGPGSA